MKVFESQFINSNNKRSVLALGNFDGVHTGHRSLLCKAGEYAEKNGYDFGVYTFSDSPKFRTAAHSVLSDTHERLSLIEHYTNADFVYLEKFDDVKDFTPDEFVDYIIAKFDVAVCFCGENFTFGKDASGTSGMLVSLMKQKGRAAVIVPTLFDGAQAVSSTRIRQLIQNGEVDKAELLLGHPFGFTSKVIHGAHLGHTLGFPTVNQIIPRHLAVPSYGVYATLVVLDEKEYKGVTNFGVKPTVSSDNAPVAETYIIDFDEDAYGKQVSLYFCKKLRDEKKFSSLDELKENIRMNAEQTVMFFKEKYEKN